MVFDRVANQILKKLIQVSGIHLDLGHRGARNLRTCLFDGDLQVCHGAIDGIVGIDGGDPFPFRGRCAGVREQIPDKLAHARCAVDRIAQIFLTFRTQFAAVSLLQQLAVNDDHPQRFLKVMRGGIGKLFEVAVGLPEAFI